MRRCGSGEQKSSVDYRPTSFVSRQPRQEFLTASPSKPLGKCLVRQCTQASGERATLIEDHAVALHIRHEERVPLGKRSRGKLDLNLAWCMQVTGFGLPKCLLKRCPSMDRNSGIIAIQHNEQVNITGVGFGERTLLVPGNRAVEHDSQHIRMLRDEPLDNLLDQGTSLGVEPGRGRRDSLVQALLFSLSTNKAEAFWTRYNFLQLTLA